MDTLTIDIGDGRALAYREYGDPRGHPVVNCHGGLLCGLDVAPFDVAPFDAAARGRRGGGGRGRAGGGGGGRRPLRPPAREAARGSSARFAASGQELARRIPSGRLELRAGEVHFLAYRHQAAVLRDLVGKPEPARPTPRASSA